MVQARENRIPIMFSEEELADIDEWRHNNRIATRADAVRRLCKIALFAEQELEQVVDNASAGVDVLSNHSYQLHEVFRLIINRETYGMTFDRDQLWDVFKLAREQADVAEEGIRGLHTMLVTIYNAIVALVEARSIRGAQRKSQEVIDKANAAIDQAKMRKAEREAQSEENRYLFLATRFETDADRAAYERLSEEEKEDYLGDQIEALREEEDADPIAFAERYGIDNRKFWEKPEWLELLEKREEERRDEESAS
ncbi:hypothetical protein HJA87_11950 [Rhizobium bangladeshense]|uniref:Uncharacterized protein n=1 Tax=Rhizobium bangladeshense TaxID=1138189 RepID=A0ABS7LHV8_9HYPH|nr:hypothetical protein [Rhizobium bangladeshense]MBY3590591.1 hypothetical protein [Rhizobium bangladeshense]